MVIKIYVAEIFYFLNLKKNSDGKIDSNELKRIAEGLLDRQVSNEEIFRAVNFFIF